MNYCPLLDCEFLEGELGQLVHYFEESSVFCASLSPASLPLTDFLS